jgi:hypothetical protein
MKQQIARILTFLSLTVLFLPATGEAQYVRRIIQAQIPFEFTVGGRTLPAGDYTVMCVAPDRLELRDSNAQAVASAITRSVPTLEKSSATKLDFSMVDGDHALTQVWIKNEITVYELAPVRAASASVSAKRRSHATASAAGAGNK